jgi:hypothetical protein
VSEATSKDTNPQVHYLPELTREQFLAMRHRGLENIPAEMRALRRWTLYRVERGDKPGKKPKKLQKVPYQRNGRKASSTNPDTWVNFDDVYPVKSGYAGINFAFAKADGLVCIDLDHSRDAATGETKPWADEIIEQVDSYTEVSVSGTGHHLVVRGAIPRNYKSGNIEIYNDKKFISMTGNIEDLSRMDIKQCDLGWLTTKLEAEASATQAVKVRANDDASAADWALIGDVQKRTGLTDAAELETAVATAQPQRYQQRNREKGLHNGKNYWRYSIERFLQRQPAPVQVAVVEEASTLPPPAASLDLPAEALDGWLGSVCRDYMADLPRGYAWLSLLAIASVHVPRETGSRCNLNVVTIGESGFGKGASAERAAWLLGTKLEAKLPGSGEGILKLTDGCEGRPYLLYADEMGQMLAKGRIENSSLEYVLSTLWGRDELELVVARNTLKGNVRLTTLGGITNDDFDTAFGAGAVKGRYRRTLFADAPPNAKFHLWQPPDTFPVLWQPGGMEGQELDARPVAVHLLDRSARYSTAGY